MLTTLRTFNPVVEVFDPYSTPFTNKIETKGRNSDNQQTNNEVNSVAMPCTACSACGVCSACSACSACW